MSMQVYVIERPDGLVKIGKSGTPEMSRYQRLIFSKDGPAANCRLLLIVLIRFWLAGSDNRIFPSEETLAEDTGLSVRTIRRLIPLLEANGWIKRKPFGVKGQAWRRNEYFLHWPDGFDPKQDKWLQEVKQRKAEGRAAYREAEGWPEPEPEPEPEPPPPPPEVDMVEVDPTAWAAWMKWRAAHGGNPTSRINHLENQGGFRSTRAWISIPGAMHPASESRAHQDLRAHRAVGEWFAVDFDRAVSTVTSHRQPTKEIANPELNQQSVFIKHYNTNQRLGMAIDQLRTKKGVNKNEMALATGIDAGNLNRIIAGTQWPSPERLDILAAYFDVKVSDLFRIGDRF